MSDDDSRDWVELDKSPEWHGTPCHPSGFTSVIPTNSRPVWCSTAQQVPMYSLKPPMWLKPPLKSRRWTTISPRYPPAGDQSPGTTCRRPNPSLSVHRLTNTVSTSTFFVVRRKQSITSTNSIPWWTTRMCCSLQRRSQIAHLASSTSSTDLEIDPEKCTKFNSPSFCKRVQ